MSNKLLRPTQNYRFRHQPGRNIQVCYRKEGRWISTGTQDEQQAIAFAERNLALVRPRFGRLTLERYARDFFTDPAKCPWMARKLPTGHTYGASTIRRHRLNLTQYILPAFGKKELSSIHRRDIDIWLRGLLGVRDYRPLSSSSKNKIIGTFRQVLDQAIWDGLINQNEAAHAQMYMNIDRKVTPTFTQDEYARFFPSDREKMIQIWGSPFWATYFLVLASSGARPGQVAALYWRDWFEDLGGLWSYASVDRLTGKIKGIKTEKHGVRAVPLLLTERANRELSFWRSTTRYPRDDDLIFRWEGNNRETLWLRTTLKHLRITAMKAGIEIRDRTTYSWRHSFATDMLEHLDRATAQEMLGHRKGSLVTDVYDHRTAEARIRTIRERAQFAIERRFS